MKAERWPGGWRTCKAWIEEFLAAVDADRRAATSAVAEAKHQQLADAALTAAGF